MEKQTINGSGARPVIELVDLVKQYGDKVVLKELNMSINKGEFVTLLGASGSGKTTALRLIGGFEFPTRGEIKFDGVDVKDLPAYKRPTNTVFQDYALFPHLTVEGNVKYGLKLFRVPKENVSSEVLSRLENRKKDWAKTSQAKIKHLLKRQAAETKLLESYDLAHQGKSPKEKLDATTVLNLKNAYTDFQARQAQKFIDKLDFQISYWENYVNQKEEAYRKRYTTRGLTKAETKAKLVEMIAMVGLTGNEKKAVDQLSGGMKQRVALARSIILEPKVLLLDEPLSALDAKIRQRMQRDLRRIQRQLGMTFVFVTHDQEEAMVMSDRVAVMREGRLEQFGTPKELYDYPVNAWVANFIGDSTLLKGTYVKKGKVKFLGQEFKCEDYDINPGTAVDVMLRPEDFEISRSKKGHLYGEIINKTFQGAMWEYRILLSDNSTRILVETPKVYDLGTNVNIDWDFMDVHVMPEEVKIGSEI